MTRECILHTHKMMQVGISVQGTVRRQCGWSNINEKKSSRKCDRGRWAWSHHGSKDVRGPWGWYLDRRMVFLFFSSVPEAPCDYSDRSPWVISESSFIIVTVFFTALLIWNDSFVYLHIHWLSPHLPFPQEEKVGYCILSSVWHRLGSQQIFVNT